jgi:benzoyl-CoA 2,3-dioxygenase component B
MLKEEAHHMFVGASGIGRVCQRTVELMKSHDTDDVRAVGGIDVPTLQRYLNFHAAVSLDLFGAERSTNTANYFASGLKGRFHETRRTDDHRLRDAVATVPAVEDGRVVHVEVPALSALNESLRGDYWDDCAKGVERWNRTLAEVGMELRLPHPGFHRRVGAYAAHHVTPRGEVVDEATWERHRDEWLPTADDQAFVGSLMQSVTEPGRMASWIAPPSAGVQGRPIDFEYVRLD